MMLTRCPACQTVFRITPEQLKARQGRVRCGGCRHVFNALDTLLDEAGPPPVPVQTAPAEPATAGPSGAPGAIAPEAGRSAADRPAEAETPAVPAQAAVPATPPPPDAEPAPSAPPAIPEEAPAPPDAAGEPAPPSAGDALAVPAGPAAPVPEGPAAPVPAAHEPIAVPAPGALVPEPPPRVVPASQGGFDPDAAPFLAEPAPARRRIWPWVLGTLLALLLLAAQAAYHFRAELAVLAPDLRPLLAEACTALGCDLPLPRQSAMLGIETSDLHPDPERKSRLLLSATLRNRAPFVQALPHLEVTLTDTADQAVVRKVLPPEAYLPARQVAEGIPPNGELPVSLAIDADGVAAAGYRLYIFYP